MSMNNIKQRSFLALAKAVLLFLCAQITLHAQGGPSKNILFIPIDDLKPIMGCYEGYKYNSEFLTWMQSTIKTPNMDKLAAKGTLFNNNSCQMAICGPSRASIMTGHYCDTTKVFNLKTKMRGQNPDILTIPQYFKEMGYYTNGTGKTFDTRCVDKNDPQSWSEKYKSPWYNGYKFKSLYKHPDTVKQKKEYEEKSKKLNYKQNSILQKKYPMSKPSVVMADVDDMGFSDGSHVDLSIKMIKKLSKENKPFFWSSGFLKPHLPFVAPKKYWDLYKREDMRLHPFQKMPTDAPGIGFHKGNELRGYSDIPVIGEPISEAKQKELIHGYLASTSYVDALVGKLMTALEDCGIADNTIICLWGDHGWHFGDHDLWCKHSNFEQAVRSPLIIFDPSQKSKGGKVDSPTEFTDIFPTLCELTGIPTPSHLPGKSLKCLLDDPNQSVREAAFSQYPRSHRGKDVMGYTVRSDRYRYTEWIKMNFHQGEREGTLVDSEFYDYGDDPMEKQNVVTQPDYKALVANHKSLLDGKRKLIAKVKLR